MAVPKKGYSGAEIVRYLGVTTSCVNWAVSSGQKRPKKRAALESYALSAPTSPIRFVGLYNSIYGI